MDIEKIDSDRFFLIILTLSAIVSVIFVILVSVSAIASEVVDIYFQYADEVMGGRAPQMEYPPFALLLLMIPRLFTDDPFVYEALFVAQTYVFFAVGLWIVRRLAAFFGKSQNLIMLVYAAFSFLMIEFIADRYDIFPIVLTLLSLYLFVTKRYISALLLLSIATMTKMYPVVLFPIYIIPFFVDRDWKNALRITGFLAAVMALLIIIPYAAGTGLITDFIGYHSGRPLQVESVAASFISVAKMLGLTDAWVEYSYGSFNLMGDWPNAVSSYMTALMGVCMLAAYAVYAGLLLKLRREGSDADKQMILFGSGALLTLLLFMMAGLVFSAQYVLWAVPFILFLLLMPIGETAKKKLLILSVVVLFLTQLNVVVNISLCGGNMEDPGLLIIFARNIALLVLAHHVFRIARDCVGGRGPSSPRSFLKFWA
ncbi:MAG: DUF2029 domain-containing protein [Candidatus Methanoplasma sp.]|jgi:hypothetical protein|nr:DUF2029 domain-containing protein [Candidatus Methanoplasma sp.]